MKLIDCLGGYKKAKEYLEWLNANYLLMGSFPLHNGVASFYTHNLESEISEYEINISNSIDEKVKPPEEQLKEIFDMCIKTYRSSQNGLALEIMNYINANI